MSGRLVSAVLESALPAWLKIYAASFASFAADDGSRVYPTVARIARMATRSVRQTKRAVRELRRLGVLETIAPSGRNTATRYLFHGERLPLAGDGAQIPLSFESFGVLPFPHGKHAKASIKTRFPQDAQALTGHPRHPRGVMGDTRSVSRSVKYTYTRANKTGTGK